MSPRTMFYQPRSHRFPRVSGDEPQYLWNLVDEYEFSPRERG